MLYPSRKIVSKYASKGLLVPIYKEIDTADDPCAVFGAFSSLKHAFLLESARMHPKTARYSFLGAEPFIVFKSKGKNIEISRHGEIESLYANPIEKLREILDSYRSARLAGLPMFKSEP